MTQPTDENEPAPDSEGPTDDRATSVLAARRARARTKRTIDRLDDRERRFSFIAAVLAAAFGIAVYVGETSNPHFRLAKNQLTPQTTLVLGLAAAALLLVTTLIGRRALVGFIALFTFLAFGTQYLLGVPFLALAVWLLYRSFKIQKEASAAARAARADGSAPSAPAGGRGSSRSAKATRGSSAKGRAAAPEANKRYTPKRPAAPPPKPSRRERKAAQSNE